MNLYEKYLELSDYHKRCLPTSNYWRVMQEQPIIEVPDYDTKYHETFDIRVYEVAKEYQEIKNRP